MSDDDYMQVCLDAARVAAERGEVPVGAAVVANGEVVAIGSNASIRESDPTAHAEIVALREACRRLGNYRLTGAELFVTMEPCLMCVGAVLQVRLARVVYGCTDAKAGFLGSLGDYSHDARLNHRFAVRGGVRADEAATLLRDFFRSRRG